MRSLVGLLLVLSGVILAIPQIYEVLTYIDYNRWPVVQGLLGITCILVGLLMTVWPKGTKRVLTEV